MNLAYMQFFAYLTQSDFNSAPFEKIFAEQVWFLSMVSIKFLQKIIFLIALIIQLFREKINRFYQIFGLFAECFFTHALMMRTRKTMIAMVMRILRTIAR